MRIKRTPVQVAGLPRVESPPRPPGELPDWQVAQVSCGEFLSSSILPILQDCIAEGGGKTPPRGQVVDIEDLDVFCQKNLFLEVWLSKISRKGREMHSNIILAMPTSITKY